MTTIPPAIETLITELSGRNIARILLFGSRARGDNAPRADVDLAIDAPDLSDEEWQRIEELAEEADTLYKIDCVRLQKVPDALKENILRDGKVLYERAT